MSDYLFNNFEKTYPVIVKRAIDWGDMDAFQHVNNIIYFRYFETARITYFDRIDFLSKLSKHQAIPVLGSTECRYRAPVTYPDTLSIGCKVKEIGEHSIEQTYEIYSHSQEKTTTLGTARIVVIDAKTGKKVEIPDTAITAIQTLEKQD